VSTSSTSFNAFYTIGGPLLSGTLRNIKVLRNQKEIATLDMYQYLTTGKCSTDVRLQNDDVLYVPRRDKTVTLTGSVFRPAVYELRQDENLQALIGFCGGILPGTNINRARIRRIKPFQDRMPDIPNIEIVGVDLEKHISENSDFPLFDNDTLEITPLSNDLENYATLSGAVHYPGIYQCDSLSIYTLIFTLGKPIESRAYTKRADLIRLNPDMTTFTTQPIDLDALTKDSSAHDLILQPFDEVIIYEKEVEKPMDLLITINGEVRNPGAYTMSTNLTVTDAILRAGGFTRDAFKKSVDVYRIKLSKQHTDTITEVFKIDLPDSISFSKASERFFQLKDRDKIIVRPDPDYIVDNYIIIEGFVKYRGSYALQQRGERLSDIIQRAGGLLPDAFLDGATITRNRKRLVVNFLEALSGEFSKENILLQKNDSISIPSRPNTVLISGNINNPGLFSYVQKSRLKTYIDRAGGFADSTSYILLTSPGGETSKIQKNGFKNPVVLEGSEIVVMRKPPRDRSAEKQGPSIAEVVRDTLAILASAVTVIGLAIQLNN
jgi:protein involved in polysaccharide export with SLBB domain